MAKQPDLLGILKAGYGKAGHQALRDMLTPSRGNQTTKGGDAYFGRTLRLADAKITD